MGKIALMYHIDVAFDPERGYAATLTDIGLKRMKGIKGGSIRQLMRRVAGEVCQDEQKKRRFPLEHEPRLVISTEEY
jgi:hypothetical protein